jgi:hypothetical protein
MALGKRRWLILLFAAQFFPSSMLVADALNHTQSHGTTNEFGIWGVVSFDTLSLGALSTSDIHGRKLILNGFRYGRSLVSARSYSLAYTLDIIPVAVAFHSQVQTRNTPSPAIMRENVYGFGVSPVGFKFNFRTNRAVQPFFALTGGFLHFQKPVPTPESTRWNFTASGGGGIQFFIANHRAMSLGYMLHHLSNGRQPKQNPSLNTQVFYFGFSFFKST